MFQTNLTGKDLDNKHKERSFGAKVFKQKKKALKVANESRRRNRNG